MRNFGVQLDEADGGGRSNMSVDEFKNMHTMLKKETDIIVDGFINIETLARLFLDQ